MSSALDSIFDQSVTVLHSSGHGRQFRVVASNGAGRQFTGTLRTEQVIDPGMELDADPREAVFLDVPNTVYWLTAQMIIEEGRVVGGSFIPEMQWKVLTQELNPADVENKYKLVKVVTDKDSP